MELILNLWVNNSTTQLTLISTAVYKNLSTFFLKLWSKEIFWKLLTCTAKSEMNGETFEVKIDLKESNSWLCTEAIIIATDTQYFVKDFLIGWVFSYKLWKINKN